MSSLLHPTVPTFYACYLLRSYPPSSNTSSTIPKPSPKTYIGSTPSPPRRLRQHNGELTAGAWRTRTGRPWEMDILVWGFGSKIAALQFEWAWQKPHLSRHLKEVGAGGGGRAIWRSKTKRGKWSPAGKVLVLRSLLRSEPFCAWGLRVTCLAEWSWKAWRMLEEEEEGRAAGRAKARGRQTGRVMPPNQLSAAVRCDFTGVSGKRKPLTAYSEEERRGMGLRDVPVAASTSSAKGKGKAKAQDKPDGRSKSTTTSWHETLPTGATARGMGVTWHELEHEVPVVPAVVPTEEQAEEQAERTWPPRFAADDADFTFLALQRLNRFCSHHNLKPQDLVPTLSSPTRPPPPSIPCTSCHTPINTQDPLSWTLCPSPFHALTPRSLDEAEYEPVPTLGNEERLGHSHCASAFHLTCLAKRWLEDEKEDKTEVLPLAGRCPTCDSPSGNHPSHASSSSSSPGLWADVVRSAHRRKEWLESGPGSLDFSLLGRVVGKARKRKRVLEDERVELSASDEEEGREESESEEEGEGENESLASGESNDGSSISSEVPVMETPAVSPAKRKVGRPKGSKNKEKEKEVPPSPPRKKGAAAAAAKGRGASTKAPSPKKASPRKRTASSKKTTAAATTSTSTASTAQPPQASSDLIASLDDMFG